MRKYVHGIIAKFISKSGTSRTCPTRCKNLSTLRCALYYDYFTGCPDVPIVRTSCVLGPRI